MRGTRTKLVILLAALVALVAATAVGIRARRDGAQQLAQRASALESERVADLPGSKAAEPSAAALAGGASELSLLVLDPASRPLEGASVLAFVRGSEQLVGSTDVEGRLRCAFPADAAARLRVELAGFRPELVLLSTQSVDPLLVVLHPLRRIEGRVRRSDGESAGADLLVMAWPRSAPPPVAAQVAFAMEREETELDAFRATRTRADGSFAFDDVPWSGPIALEAGGFGLLTSPWIANDPPSRSTAAAGDARSELRVVRGYGAVVELVEAGGAPLVRAGGVPWPATIDTRDRSTRGSTALVPSAIAAGFDPALVEGRIDRVPVLVAGDLREDLLEGVSFSMDAAGYAPVQASFDVPSLERVTPIVRVVITRTASGFGELHLRFANAPAALASIPRERYATGRLELAALDGSGMRMYAVTPDATWHARLVDLPHGGFSLRFRLAGFSDPALALALHESAARGFADPPAQSPGAPVTIGTAPAQHTVDLAGLNWIVIEVEDAQGVAWSGKLQAMLVDGDLEDRAGGGMRIGGAMRTLSFAAPPYVFAGLRPETPHALRLSTPRALSLASGSATERFSLPAGAAQLLRFRVAD